MNRLYLGALTLLCSITTGCGGGSSSGDASTTTPSAPPPATSTSWTLVPAAQPLTVSPVVDNARETVQDVPLTGGTLIATAADGTTFTLTIPADALDQPTTIAMTPVTLPSQPFGSGPAVGVQFLPDGLTFYKPARLVITPPAGAALPPVGQGLAITWSGADNHVGLAPAASGNGSSMDLLHFSNYANVSAQLGVASVLPQVSSQLGATPLERWSDALGANLASQHRIAEGSTEALSPTQAEVDTLKQQFANEQVPAMIAAAGSSCAQGRDTIKTFLALDRMLQLLGLGNSSYGANALGLFDTVASVCVEEEWKKCRDFHIIQDIIPVQLQFVRQQELLGMGAAVPKDWQVKLGNYILQCHRFKVDYDSTASTNAPGSDGFSFSQRMLASVNIATTGADPLASRITGQDTLMSMKYDISYNNTCFTPVGVTQVDSQLTIANLTWDIKGGGPKKADAGELAYLKLDYFPAANSSSHQVQDICTTPRTPPGPGANLNYTIRS